MTADITETTKSRRALLFAGLGAAGAAVAASVARINPAAAADGDAVTVGSSNTGDTATVFDVKGSNALAGTSDSGRGVDGTSTSGQGVHGTSSSSAGVAGVSNSGNAVHGTSTSSRGVYGVSTSGVGVEGSGATGVKAESTNGGFALETISGRVRFEGISGITTIASGQTNVTVKPDIPVSSNTMVLLTPQANIGNRSIWYQKESDPAEIVIHMNQSRSNDTKIAYLILEHA